MKQHAPKRDIVERFQDGDYLKNNLSWHAEDSPWKAAQILKILSDNKVHFDTMAEVGCGAGEILLNLAKSYPLVDMMGFELSTDAFEICSAKKSETVSFELSNIAEVDRVFDVILCIDVFEHVENYIGFLKSLRLKSKQHIFHIPLDISASATLRGTFADARNLVGHLHYFTQETALATLRDAGYTIQDYFFTAPFASDGVPVKSTISGLARYPRRLLFKLSPTFTSRLVGGCSLLVLTGD